MVWVSAETIATESPRSASIEFIKDTPPASTPTSDKYAGPASQVQGAYDPSRQLQGIAKRTRLAYNLEMESLAAQNADLEAELEDWRELERDDIETLVEIRDCLAVECRQCPVTLAKITDLIGRKRCL